MLVLMAAMPRRSAFHIMTKPIGPICNLNCSYCFYLEKEGLYERGEHWKMSDAVLESYVRQYIQSQETPEITFAWQGGEPTLLGVEFFERVVQLQKQYADGRPVSNAIQTNGTLLDDRWCEFLAANQFLVGLSVDGPKKLHDQLRVDKQGNGTFDQVMRGLGFLKKHGTEFNTLTVVNRVNADHPLEVYRFLTEIGSRYLQFIPLVERLPESQLVKLHTKRHRPSTEMPQFAPPPIVPRLACPAASSGDADLPVSGDSVLPTQYGQFLCRIFDHWVQRDVGKIFVQLFDTALGNWLGVGSSLCVFAETCGGALAIEHNGDLYACDHYVYPEYRLGNIMTEAIGDMAGGPRQAKFGTDKRDTLPKYCRDCSVRFACNGECPKHRFLKTPDGEEGLNYLCAAYKMFFTHIDQPMQTMAALLKTRRPAAEIMELYPR